MGEVIKIMSWFNTFNSLYANYNTPKEAFCANHGFISAHRKHIYFNLIDQFFCTPALQMFLLRKEARSQSFRRDLNSCAQDTKVCISKKIKLIWAAIHFITRILFANLTFVSIFNSPRAFYEKHLILPHWMNHKWDLH